MTCVELCVPKGYRILEKIQTTDLAVAYNMLVTKKQKKYTAAKNTGDNAVLKKHVIKCPFCGGEQPAYNEMSFDYYTPVGSDELAKWADIQVSLFTDTNKTIKLRKPYVPNDSIICPRCLCRSVKSEEQFKLKIGNCKKTAFISREITNVEDMLSISWAQDIDFCCASLTEIIVFDFQTGHTCLRLEEENGKQVAFKDITFSDYRNDIGTIGNLIEKNKVVKRTLKRCFQQNWPCELPYSNKEIGITEWIMLTYFIGYEKNFYDTLPLDYCNRIAGCFNDIAPKIRTPKMALDLFFNSNLPQCKSVKKLFVTHPCMFFFIDECYVVYKLFNDVNRFIKCMNLPGIYKFLSDIRKFPGILTFFNDYLKQKTPADLLNIIVNRQEDVTTFAIRYNSFSNYEKECAMQGILELKTDYFCSYSRVCTIDAGYNLPMSAVPERIADCAIDDFSFKWLKTKKDYRYAGTMLENCLVNWSSTGNPVVAVYRRKKIVAAIEVDGEFIVQMLGHQNSYIKEDSPLGIAIDKWCKKYNLKEETSFGFD